MTIEDLASEAGMSYKGLCKIISGETKKPSMESILRICLAMGEPIAITLLMLKEVGYDISTSADEKQALYLYLLIHLPANLKKWNEYLAAHDLPQLGNSEVQYSVEEKSTNIEPEM